jgi:DNA-directed RNA polymerase omega subunit
MTGIVEVSSNVPNDNTPAQWPGIVSRFQLVILAAHRNKQLLLGAQPRIAADRLKRRNTSIALEELKRGLILFKPVAVEEAQAWREIRRPSEEMIHVVSAIGRKAASIKAGAEYSNQ